MSMFDYVRKKLGETAHTTAKKSKELLEIAKLNMNISTEEDKIKELQIQIGGKVYANYTADSGAYADFNEACESIKNHENAIDELKQKIQYVKNVTTCSVCGIEMDKSAVYCSKCGARI